MLTRTAYRMKPPQAARLVSGHPLARDLVLDMSLREGSGVTAFDAGGRRHDGTIQTGATWTMGKYGPALDLDGAAGHVEIADHADFTPSVLGPELVTNGDFTDWTSDDPDGWTVTGEVGDDPEVSEAATGEAHADTPTPGGGMCNIYTSAGVTTYIEQDVTLVIGRKYSASILINTITTNGCVLFIYNGVSWESSVNCTIAKTYKIAFTALGTVGKVRIREIYTACDVTLDDVSIKEVLPRPFSIAAHIYMHDATNFMIASKGVYNTDGEWCLALNDADKLFFLLYDETVDNCYIGRTYNTALTAYQNQWVRLLATYDGGVLSSGVKLYLNGTKIDDTDFELGTFVASAAEDHAVWIGKYITAHADGLVGDIKMWRRVLTLSDAQLIRRRPFCMFAQRQRPRGP